MSQFLQHKFKELLTLKRAIYSEITRKERHHLALSHSKYDAQDVILLQSEDDELINAKHPAAAQDYMVMITTKEVFRFGDKSIVVYGFTGLNDLPASIINVMDSVYRANVSLSESNEKMLQAGIEYL
jgi:hypothetical protein